MGRHLLNHLIQQKSYDKIINLDLNPPAEGFEGDDTVHYLNCDLRKPVDAKQLSDLGCDEHSVIYNLAAICRIPGFPDRDYFETNILGAEHTVQLAEDLNFKSIVFTSSIAPYGASEELKTEESIPMPDNPYGSSKLVAEYVHKAWWQRDKEHRNLTILRPGIIFGAHEQANFTRLYKSLKKGYFVYPGRKDTKKACVYVKDVARACLHFAEQKGGCQLFNLVYQHPPTIEKICELITKHTDAGKAKFTIPGPLLVTAAYGIKMIGGITGRSLSGIHPDRVKKVMISTNVSGSKLGNSTFEIKYQLDEAIIDWYQECGETLF